MEILRELWRWTMDIWDSGQFYGRAFILFVALWLTGFVVCSFSGAPMELAAFVGLTPIVTFFIWAFVIGPMPFVLLAAVNATVGKATGRKLDFGEIPRFFGGVLLLGLVLSAIPWKNDLGASLLIVFFALIIGARRWGKVRKWLRRIENALLEYALPVAIAVLLIVLFYGGRAKAAATVSDPNIKTKAESVLAWTKERAADGKTTVASAYNTWAKDNIKSGNEDKPITVACDPTGYNATLAERRAGDHVTLVIPPNCPAAEKVTIAHGKTVYRKTTGVTDTRVFNDNEQPYVICDVTDNEGWFADSPAKYIPVPDGTAIQYRNATANAITVRLEVLN